ncbi:unnamed protein product [Urochloa humidicola]
MEAAIEKRLFSIMDRIWDITEMTGDERAKAEEERLLLKREYERLIFEMRDPDFSGMSEAQRAEEARKLRHEKLEEARRLKEAGDLDGGKRREGEARIIDFDPKQEGMYYNRLCFVDLATFDHEEDSPLGPMRFTETAMEEAEFCAAVNILSVKIACSDVGFPILVYGTIVARDSMDRKRVPLFGRSRDHAQLIKSKDKPLLLTGPKRGLVLLSDIYVEIDLKIKDRYDQDKALSKGFLSIRGTSHRSMEQCEVETESLATRLSTVDVMYAAVKDAVEATLAFQVLRGKFRGTITAHTTSILERIMLYDSKVVRGDGRGVIRPIRRVISVDVEDMLIIEAKTGDGKSVRRIELTPRANSGDEDVVTVGDTKMRVMVSWSIMDP